MRIVCQQMILMIYMYQALFVIFEKVRKFETADYRWRIRG